MWDDNYKAIHEEVDEWLAENRARAAAEAASHDGVGVGVGGGGDGGDGRKKKKDGDVDHRLDMPNMQAVNAPVNPNSAANNSANPNLIANVLTKVDIVIHYLQVYGMVLVMDINIPYPQAFKDWSSWIRISTLNLDDIWSMNLAYQQEALFAIVMLIPALLLALYFYFDRLRGRQVQQQQPNSRPDAEQTLRGELSPLSEHALTLLMSLSLSLRVCVCVCVCVQDNWAESYVTNWRMVKWRTFLFYVLFNLVSATCCLLFINDFESVDRFKAKQGPTPAALTWALVIFCGLSIWYLCWFRIVRLFQKHWAQDASDDKLDFKSKWLNLIHWLQIFFLFVITSVYLPVARVILIQFACDCVTQNSDTLCTSRLYSSNTCFPYPVTRVQIAAFCFGVLYIGLLPLFIIKLIREGIAIVMDLNTVYDNLARDTQALRLEIKRLKTLKREAASNASGQTPQQRMQTRAVLVSHIQENQSLILAKTRCMEAEYFSRINDPIRKLASTSLYAAYEYDWRFWKIIQLVQNLLLVCISLFVPRTIGLISQARLFLGTFAIGGCFLFVCCVLPYYDSWEDGMEIAAGFANTVTVLVALGLQYEVAWLTTARSNAILLGANITAMAAFIIAVVFVPFRICRQKRRHKKQLKETEARMKALNEENANKRAAKLAGKGGAAASPVAAAAAGNGGKARAVVPDIEMAARPSGRK